MITERELERAWLETTDRYVLTRTAAFAFAQRIIPIVQAAERERWTPLLRAAGRVLQAADDGYLQPSPETLQGGIAVDELREAWGAFAPARIRGA